MIRRVLIAPWHLLCAMAEPWLPADLLMQSTPPSTPVRRVGPAPAPYAPLEGPKPGRRATFNRGNLDARDSALRTARRWLQSGTSHGEWPVAPNLLALRECLDLQHPDDASPELCLLEDTEPLVRTGDWHSLLDALGDPGWLRAALAQETPCKGTAAHSQANRLAALGRFLFICRVLAVPALQRDAVGEVMRRLLALPHVQARHRLLCRLCAALLPSGDATVRDHIVALQRSDVPTKAVPLRLAMRLYLEPQVSESPAVQALLGSRAIYGDGNLVRQFLQLIMEDDQPDYARQVLSWANRTNLTSLLEAQRTRAVPAERRALDAVAHALDNAVSLDAAFYSQPCVRTFLNAHVLPLQLELIACAELVRSERIKLHTLTCPADIYARCAKALQLDPEVFVKLQHGEPTLRYALGFRSSQAKWSSPALRQQGARVLRELLQACADDALDAYRRQSPQAQKLLQSRGGEQLMAAWETSTPQSIAWGSPEVTAMWTVDDTGHPTQQLACVTQISSCQSNHSGLALNYCMLGRLVCGSKRTARLRDERGTLRARAMMRLVHLPDGKPALLLSPTYPAAGLGHRAQRALEAYAGRRAGTLGIVGLAVDPRGGTRRSLRLRSVGTLSDYWDETGGSSRQLDDTVCVRALT